MTQAVRLWVNYRQSEIKRIRMRLTAFYRRLQAIAARYFEAALNVCAPNATWRARKRLREICHAQRALEALQQNRLIFKAVADPERLDIAESFISRCAIKADHMSRRISENAEGLLERDARLLAQVSDPS